MAVLPRCLPPRAAPLPTTAAGAESPSSRQSAASRAWSTAEAAAESAAAASWFVLAPGTHCTSGWCGCTSTTKTASGSSTWARGSASTSSSRSWGRGTSPRSSWPRISWRKVGGVNKHSSINTTERSATQINYKSRQPFGSLITSCSIHSN